MGTTAEACDEWGIPLVAMMYFIADEKTNAFDPDAICHVARMGAELGADIIKTRYTGDPSTFKKVIEGCSVPVVIAGGEKTETDDQILEMVRGAMDAGAGGVSIGRNAFQHQSPEKITRALYNIVHHDHSIEKAKKDLVS